MTDTFPFSFFYGRKLSYISLLYIENSMEQQFDVLYGEEESTDFIVFLFLIRNFFINLLSMHVEIRNLISVYFFAFFLFLYGEV